MKQLNTLQKSEKLQPDKKGWRLWMFMLFAVLAGTASGYGQNITWTMKPTLTDGNPTAYGESTRLDFAFSSNQAISNARIVITTPQGFVYDGIVDNRAGNIAGSPAVSSTDLTFTYTSLAANTPVDLGILLKAENAQAGDITVAIYKGTETTALNSEKTAIKGILKPNIRIDMTNPVVSFSDAEFTAKTAKNFNLNVSTTEGTATSFKVMLQVEAWTMLSDFSMGTNTITVGAPVEVTGTGTNGLNNDRKYTLTITPSHLSNGKLTAASQTLSFKAYSTMKGKRPVKATWQYPADTEYTKGNAVQTFYLGYQDVAGEPIIRLGTYKMQEATDAEWYKLYYNNSTLNHLEVTYTNNGTSAKGLVFTGYSPNHLESVDINGIKCYIDNIEVTISSVDPLTYFTADSEDGLHYPTPPISTFRITLDPEVTFPKGSTLKFIIPSKLGQIYDNRTSSKDHHMRYNRHPLQYYLPQVYYAVTEGGKTQLTSDRIHTGKGSSIPQMLEPYLPFFVKAGDIQTTQISIAPYSIAQDKYSQEIFVRVPKWLTLKNTTVSYKNTNGDVISDLSNIPVSGPTADGGDHFIYSWTINKDVTYNDNATIDLTFEGDGSYQDNIEGQIAYWIDWKLNNTNTLTAITQRYQTVTLLSKQKGIRLDQFEAKRLDIGYIDTNGNGYADSNSQPTDPRNDLYYSLDNGQLIWQATVLVDGDGMDHLYLPLETSVGNLLVASGGYFNPEINNIELKIERSSGLETRMMSYKEVSNQSTQRYLWISGFTFEKDDKLTITMPFKSTSTGLYKFGHITTGCLLHNANISETNLFTKPESPVGLGFDKSSVSLWSVGWYTYIFGQYDRVRYFSSETPVKLSSYIGAVYPFYNLSYPGGSWRKEARTDKMPYATKVTLVVPDGYSLEEVEFKSSASISSGVTPSVIINKNDPTFSVNENTYTFDLSNIWVDTEAEYIAGQKIPKMGRQHFFSITPTVKASKNASTTAQEVGIEVIFGNASAGGYPTSIKRWASTPMFQYTGVTTELKSTVVELPASISTREVPLTISNPNGFTMLDNYLYVTGDITYPDTKLELVPTGNTTGLAISPISGGVGYSWFKLPDLASGGSLDYILNFTYSGAKDGGDITMYTVSAYNGATPLPSGITSSSLDPSQDTNKPFLGASKEIKIVPATVILGGAIIVDKTELKIDDNAPYTIKASINSRNSKGEIINPVMKISVPKGFKYKDNSAKLYWGGSILALTSAEEAAFAAAFATTTQANSYDLNIVNTWKNAKDKNNADCFMLPVKGADNELEVYLEAQFILDCETDLFNVYFTNELSGKSVYEDAVSGSQAYYTNAMAAKLQPAENFAIQSNITTDVFTKDQTTATYTVTFNRELGYGSMTAEKLVVVLPRTLNIDPNGSVSVSGGLTSTGIIDNQPTGTDDRTITITFPYTEMNAMADKKAEITYSFPLKSSFDGTDPADLLTAPQKTITAYVTTEMSLSGCSNTQPFPASDLDLTNILFFTYTLPTINAASLGTAYEVTTSTTGVDGTISIGSDQGTFSNGKWSVTPSTAIIGNDETRTVTVTPKYNGVYFNPITASIKVYPSLVFNAALSATLCNNGSNTQDLTALITGDAIAAGSSTVMKYYEGSNPTALTNTSVMPTVATDYYVQAETHDGVLKSEKQKIALAVSTSVSAGLIVNKTAAIVGETITLTASGAQTAGNGTHYQFYKGGTALDSPTQTATKTYSVVAGDVGNLSFTVQVVNSDNSQDNLCGSLESTAVSVTVTDRPDNISIGTSNETIYSCDATATLNLMSLIDNAASYTNGETFHWNTTGNTTNTETFISTISLTASVGSGTSHTIYVWAKNSDNYSETAEVLSVTAIQNTGVSLADIPELILEAAAGTNATATITAIASGSVDPVTGKYSYTLYDSSNGIADGPTGNTGAHTFADQSVAAPALTYTVADHLVYTFKVTAAGACTPDAEKNVNVKVYPNPSIASSSLASLYCESDATLLGGIDLWDYIDNPNTNLFIYSYSDDGGSSYTEFSSGDITIPTSVGTHSYTLKVVNKLGSSTKSETLPVSVTVEEMTRITSVSGYDVTEGEAVHFSVSGTGQGTLEFEWQKWDGSNWQSLAPASTNTTYTLTTSVHITQKGERYRVVATGQGSSASCLMVTQEFTLNVKSSTVPPLGNNKVTWTVIGYGTVSVTADGVSISNGSHVNDGTTLRITGTTWLSNALESITINGSKYNTSPASYIANGADVHIVVEFNGSDPNPDPNRNAEIENGNCIWTEGGYACIYTETATRARIVTFNGRLVTDQKLAEGECRIQLPDGYYIVILSDGTTKKIAIRNF